MNTFCAENNQQKVSGWEKQFYWVTKFESFRKTMWIFYQYVNQKRNMNVGTTFFVQQDICQMGHLFNRTFVKQLFYLTTNDPLNPYLGQVRLG